MGWIPGMVCTAVGRHHRGHKRGCGRETRRQGLILGRGEQARRKTAFARPGRGVCGGYVVMGYRASLKGHGPG